MQTSQTFTEERRHAIGGSDVAALFGLSPYASAHDVYMRLVGLSDDELNHQWLRIGQKAERMIRELYAEDTGNRVDQHEEAFRHPDYPFLIGHVDGLAYNGSDTPIIFEAKNVGARNAWMWSQGGDDEIPPFYNLQVQHYMMVVGAALGRAIPHADVAALVGGNEFRIFKVMSNAKLQKAIIDRASDFWAANVQPQIPPAIDGSEGAERLLKKLYPKSSEGEMEADEETAAIVIRRSSLDAQAKQLSAEIRECDNKIKDKMGLFTQMNGPGWRVRWSTSKDSKRVDYKAIVQEAELPADLIEKHTVIKEGSRRFYAPKIKEECNG